MIDSNFSPSRVFLSLSASSRMTFCGFLSNSSLSLFDNSSEFKNVFRFCLSFSIFSLFRFSALLTASALKTSNNPGLLLNAFNTAFLFLTFRFIPFNSFSSCLRSSATLFFLNCFTLFIALVGSLVVSYMVMTVLISFSSNHSYFLIFSKNASLLFLSFIGSISAKIFLRGFDFS